LPGEIPALGHLDSVEFQPRPQLPKLISQSRGHLAGVPRWL
jgi:hypothetical protein